ncbi:hypothetical protein COEREDRAFT_11980 [Coemansia reversa NRRL 1564]|uniref:Uncharacterized protein n=1 Tax=Coemansia reversa (strain ATCC 12441 / NRRL 1564) TaxID=763665 RepID=A0A2G5B1Q8_COERN|nr:hypothetical protein COEREDRAFT_11980 [Coemansia reversa NRRL 1564]|eukprot:PIA12945.1 hypothetical protein COEREDRAFT_11980 [Coemansia reversa NRRL 1564]
MGTGLLYGRSIGSGVALISARGETNGCVRRLRKRHVFVVRGQTVLLQGIRAGAAGDNQSTEMPDAMAAVLCGRGCTRALDAACAVCVCAGCRLHAVGRRQQQQQSVRA